MSDFTIPNMHDWTLLVASYDWAAAEVTLNFKTTEGTKVLIASKATELHVPQCQSWGRSRSINGVKLIAGIERSTLQLQMQSGDVIAVEAAKFEVR